MANRLFGMVGLFQKLLQNTDERLVREIMNPRSNDIYVTAPDIIITLLLKELIILSEVDEYEDITQLNWLKEITIFPSADWAITVYHKEYTLCKEEWMISKLPVNVPIVHTEPKLRLQTIYLNEIITTTAGHIALN